jgi:hypothetical protein
MAITKKAVSDCGKYVRYEFNKIASGGYQLIQAPFTPYEVTGFNFSPDDGNALATSLRVVVRSKKSDSLSDNSILMVAEESDASFPLISSYSGEIKFSFSQLYIYPQIDAGDAQGWIEFKRLCNCK